MGWQDAPVVAAVPPSDLPVPAWQRAPRARDEEGAPAVSAALKQHFEFHAREAKSFDDYLSAGFQQSVTGLAARGKAPDVAVGPETSWYGRFTANVAGMAGDIPAMIPGFMGGAAAGGAAGTAVAGPPGAAAGALMGGFGGANALPAALRTAMMDAYTRGEITSASEFIERALHVAWETTKAGVVGVATGGAGKAASVALPTASGIVTKAVVPTAAQIGTMTTVGAALEGRLPEPQDFLDAAIVIGGLSAAGAVATRLRRVYAATGKTPTEVVADATRDPSIKAELVEGTLASAAAGPEQLTLPGIPKAYQPAAQSEAAHQIVPGEKAAKAAASPFALELPQAPGEPTKPTHVNYNHIDSPIETKLALARLSELYETEIQSQRRGTVSWEQTSTEAARLLSDTLGGVDTKLLMPREPGTPAGAAEILARKQMVVGAAEAMMAARDDLLGKGGAATLEDRMQFMAAVERTAMIQSEFLGARAEVGRAMNILKSTAIEADRVKQIQDVLNVYGKDPVKLAEMLRSIDNPAGALKFARDAVKATIWEKVVEAWKAGILSGPVTHMANILGNGVFATMRAPIDGVAALIGKLHGGERVAMMEPIARLAGIMQGTLDGLKVAGEVMRTGEQPGKSEQFRSAIEGTKGEVIRLPFRFLSAEDAVFNTMNQRGEAYALAVRQATKEGLNPLAREFRERVASLVQNDEAIAKAADAAGTRFTFNTEMGKMGGALQGFVRSWHLELIVPFIRTPGNILKEMARMTPLAPLVKEWRDAIAKGGAARDQAVAELVVGSTVATMVFYKALDGDITGAGEPDAGKRHVAQSAGWQPYSIRVGDKYYSYQRLQPLGTLIGMAADAAEVWDHFNDEEADKIPKMISAAFANAVTNQTALQGITSIVQVMADPQRYGPRFLQQYAGSVVPNIVGQTTAMNDPIVREVDSMLDAMKARVPGLRSELRPKRDIFGEPIQTKERLGAISPITETEATDDKVRAEAERLGLSAADAPKKAHVGRGSGKLGDVKLEPDQRDRFSDVSGHLAHEILSPIVNSREWDATPDLIKKRIYAKAFMQAHRAGALAALPVGMREAIAQEITEKMQVELAPAEE